MCIVARVIHSVIETGRNTVACPGARSASRGTGRSSHFRNESLPDPERPREQVRLDFTPHCESVQLPASPHVTSVIDDSGGISLSAGSDCQEHEGSSLIQGNYRGAAHTRCRGNVGTVLELQELSDVTENRKMCLAHIL